MANEAHGLAGRIGHRFNSTFALTGGSECLLLRGDTEYLLRCCDDAKAVVDEAALGDFAQHVLVDNWRGRAYTRMGDFEAGYRLTRLATSLAKLTRAQDRRLQARDLLSPVYEWFTEGFDTADLRDAQVVLDQLY